MTIANVTHNHPEEICSKKSVYLKSLENTGENGILIC